MDEISAQFARAWNRGGSHCITECTCGRTHFTDEMIDDQFNPDTDDINLYQRLLKLSEEKPDRYVSHTDECILSIDVFGWTLVEGCPCKSDIKYEEMIWNYRENIMKYLQFRIPMETFTAALTDDKEKLAEFAEIKQILTNLNK